MTDHVFIPFNGRVLALDAQTFQDAVELADKIMPSKDTKARTDDDKPLWLTVSQVSRLCNVSETHLRDEIALGNIKTRRFGRGVRIHRDFVEHQTGHLDCNAESDK